MRAFEPYAFEPFAARAADTARTTGGQSKNKDSDIDDTSTSSSEENNEDLAEAARVPPDSFAMLAGDHASWYVEV